MDGCTRHRINYFALNVQFVDSKNEERIFTLAVRDTASQHSSDFIQRLVEDVLKDFEISKQQVLAVVTDNASNVILAVQKLSEDSITVVAENEDELEGISILEEETSLAFRYDSEAYLVNNSYKVVQAGFWRKFQCPQAPSKSRIFNRIQKFRVYGTVQNLNSKCLRNTDSGRRVRARTQRNTAGFETLMLYGTPTPLRPFAAYFGEKMTFMRRDFNHRNVGEWLYTECSLKIAEVYWIFVGFDEILWVLFILDHPVRALDSLGVLLSISCFRNSAANLKIQ